MLNKAKGYITMTIDRFRDLTFSGQIVFAAIILLISWSGVRAIQSNYALEEQITQLKQQNQLAKLQNEDIALQNQYYQSNQYLQLSARENLGLGLPGESELLVPDNVALSYTVSQPSTNTTTGKTSDSTQSDFSAWVDFFLHRNNFSS